MPSQKIHVQKTELHKKQKRLAIVQICFFLSFLLFACQQLRLKNYQSQDYSEFLPPGQLLYLGFRIPPSPKDEFPYQEFAAKILEKGPLQKFTLQFIANRLLRGQIAIGAKGEVYALNQLLLKPRLFHNQLKRQKIWQRNAQSYYNQDFTLALQMPQPNLLYLSAMRQTMQDLQQAEQNAFTQAWANSTTRQNLPNGFQELQEQHPLVAYSPSVLALINSPALQHAFPEALSPFAQIGAQLPLAGLLVWIESPKIDKETDNKASKKTGIYILNLRFETNSLLLSKGLETGFRLFLPSLLSKQAFIRSQLPNVRMESTEQHLDVRIPLDKASLLSIAERLNFL